MEATEQRKFPPPFLSYLMQVPLSFLSHAAWTKKMSFRTIGPTSGSQCMGASTLLFVSFFFLSDRKMRIPRHCQM